MIKEHSINTNKKNEMIDITSQVSEVAKNIDEGVITVFVPHTTAAVTINESADPDVKDDLLMKFDELAIHSDYKHSEGNSDAHVKASLIGSSEHIMVKDGGLVLGTWQKIYFCEFDGPRKRKLLIKN